MSLSMKVFSACGVNAEFAVELFQIMAVKKFIGFIYCVNPPEP